MITAIYEMLGETVFVQLTSEITVMGEYVHTKEDALDAHCVESLTTHEPVFFHDFVYMTPIRISKDKDGDL